MTLLSASATGIEPVRFLVVVLPGHHRHYRGTTFSSAYEEGMAATIGKHIQV
jgi:hypothetical protein